MNQQYMRQRATRSAGTSRVGVLMKHLENIFDAEIVDLNIPAGVPLIYAFDDTLRVVARYYLDDVAAADVAA